MGNFVSYRDAQIFQKNEGSNKQSSKEDVVVSNIFASSKNQQPTFRALKANHIDLNHDDPQGEQFSKEQKNENGSLNSGEKKCSDNPIIPKTLFNKELVILIDDCFKNSFKDMVNSTAQHPKTRNPTSTVTTNSNSHTASNNSTASTRDPAVVKEHIINETIKIMTTKSPLVTPVIEVNNLYLLNN